MIGAARRCPRPSAGRSACRAVVRRVRLACRTAKSAEATARVLSGLPGFHANAANPGRFRLGLSRNPAAAMILRMNPESIAANGALSELRLALPDPAATDALGAAIAPALLPGMTLYLSGNLGAGKTSLARAMLRALGHEGRVKSPTYTLVEVYAVSRLNFYHFDFYRFKDRSEWLSSGFREHFNSESLCVVEWPERAGDLLSPPDLDIQLEYDAQSRTATAVAHSDPGKAWLAAALSRWRSP